MAAGVVPLDHSYQAGTPERYGAVGDGVHDDTYAMTKMISCNTVMTFGPGKSYAVTTISFPYGKQYFVNFNGSHIKGIAASATTCIVALLMEGSTFIGYHVSGHNRASNPNRNYTCGTWWYNSTASSQYNTFLGIRHGYLVRGMIYGALPGGTSTRFAQSENNIYGWRTRGVQNPFYSNCILGVLFFSDPIFVSLHEEWTSPFSYANARALEIYAGAVYVQGGEIQIASSTEGYAADLQDCVLEGMNVETANPIQIIGDGVQIRGGIFSVDVETQPAFKVKAGVAGLLFLSDARFVRAASVGSRSPVPIVDARIAASTFEIFMCGTHSFEWRWSLVGGDSRLVQGGSVRYRNHRMSISAADPNVYVLNTGPTDSLLDGTGFDRLGYTKAGWYLNVDYGAGSKLLNSSVPGPAGYLSSQLSIVATGNAAACIADCSTLDSLRANCIRISPRDLFWISCWMNVTAGGNGKLTARFFDLDGKFVAETVVADSGAVFPGVWKFLEGPLAVPPSAAFMAPGITANESTVSFTDLRLCRAS